MSDSGWQPILEGVFLGKRGPAYDEDVEPSQAKLCFTATEPEILHAILEVIAARPDCWYVKRDTSPRAGMYRGRAFVMGDAAVGELWSLYKSHPRVHCGVQDDRFTMRFRPLEHLFGHLEDKRGGRIVLDEGAWPEDVVDPIEALNTRANGCGLRSRAEDWHSVDLATARAILASLLARRLGDHAPLLSRAVARRHADRFVTRVGQEGVFFTVEPLGSAHVREETPTDFLALTDARYDSGVVSVESGRIAIFWVADE